MRSKLLSIGVVGIVIGVLLSTAAVFAGSLNPPVAAAAAQAPDVPMDWWAAVQEEIRQSEYDITWQEGTYLPDLPAAYQAPNRAQGLRTYFGPDGPVVVPRVDAAAWRLDLRVAAEGAQPLQVAGNRVQYRYSNLVVEYANTDQGVDQTFTLPAPLGGAEGIALELALDTDLAARLSDDGMAVEFAGASGAAVLRYSLGAATDAQGQPLAARLELAGRSLRLAVAGRQAYSLAVTAQLRSTVPRAVAAAAPEGLSTTAAWTAESDQVEAEFGVAVGTAGDVNGDGYADVIVGAWLYDNGQTDEGRAFVYHGSAAGLSTTAAWTAESDQDYAEFGVAVGTAGDVNGDGYADVIVGAWLYSNGQSYEGRAFVYYGNGGDGLDVKAQQRRADDSAPVAPGGQVVNPAGARLAALLRTPFGRSDVALKWEVKPEGTAFDGSGLGQSAWIDSGVAGTSLNPLVSGLAFETRYHWRVRILGRPAGAATNRAVTYRSRWLNGATFFTALSGQQAIGGTGTTNLLGRAPYVDVTSLTLRGYPNTEPPNASSIPGYGLGTAILDRYFSLEPNGGADDYTLTLCLNYDDGEVTAADANESALQLCRWTGSVWACKPRAAASSTGANLVCADDVNAFSNWAIASGDPLAVTLAAFDAQGQADRVVVTWETVSELDNAGFTLYRGLQADGSDRALLTYVASQAPGSTQGASYSYEDTAVEVGQTYWYWLEDIDLAGATTLHGSVSATVQAPTAVTLSSISASPAAAPALPWLLLAAGAGLALGLSRLIRRA